MKSPKGLCQCQEKVRSLQRALGKQLLVPLFGVLCIEEEFQEGSRVQRVEMPKTMRHRNLLTRSDLLLPQWAKQKQQEGEKRSEQPTPTFEEQKLHGA